MPESLSFGTRGEGFVQHELIASSAAGYVCLRRNFQFRNDDHQLCADKASTDEALMTNNVEG